MVEKTSLLRLANTGFTMYRKTNVSCRNPPQHEIMQTRREANKQIWQRVKFYKTESRDHLRQPGTCRAHVKPILGKRYQALKRGRQPWGQHALSLVSRAVQVVDVGGALRRRTTRQRARTMPEPQPREQQQRRSWRKPEGTQRASNLSRAAGYVPA